jgi:hypothetical protein
MKPQALLFPLLFVLTLPVLSLAQSYQSSYLFSIHNKIRTNHHGKNTHPGIAKVKSAYTDSAVESYMANYFIKKYYQGDTRFLGEITTTSAPLNSDISSINYWLNTLGLASNSTIEGILNLSFISIHTFGVMAYDEQFQDRSIPPETLNGLVISDHQTSEHLILFP